MPLFSSCRTATSAIAFTAHYPFGEACRYSEIQNHTCRIKVVSFPFAGLADLASSGNAVAGCYILANRTTAYVGETCHVARRLAQHRDDPAKAFADTVYVVCGAEPHWLDKSSVLYLQWRLTSQIEETGAVTVQMGARPRSVNLQPYKQAWLEQYVADAEQLLRVAGCPAFQQPAADPEAAAIVSGCRHDTSPNADEASMQIGFGVRAGPYEFELDYVGLRAWGYHADDGFVVSAGSEIRLSVNPSANPIVHRRRADLEREGVLARLPGVEDRLRLTEAVWFASPAIAAKVVTGAHVSGFAWVTAKTAPAVRMVG